MSFDKRIGERNYTSSKQASVWHKQIQPCALGGSCTLTMINGIIQHALIKWVISDHKLSAFINDKTWRQQVSVTVYHN